MVKSAVIGRCCVCCRSTVVHCVSVQTDVMRSQNSWWVLHRCL